MKLKQHKGDSVDLKQQEKKYQWAAEIVDKLTVKFPIMTSIAKNTKSTHINFIGLARHVSLAESLIFKSKRFRTTSEVCRASMYLSLIHI